MRPPELLTTFVYPSRSKNETSKSCGSQLFEHSEFPRDAELRRDVAGLLQIALHADLLQVL